MRIRRSTAQPVIDLHRRMEEVMERLLRDAKPLASPAPWTPRVDIHETAGAIVVTLEIPGVQRDAIDIVVEGLYLTVSGERAETLSTGCLRWHQMEIAHGRFERVLALPQEVDAERITATYKDGFLTITIPRGTGGCSVPIGE